MNKGKHYYNNGVEERVFGIDEKIPEGYTLGRLPKLVKSTLGKHWYNNGIESKFFSEDNVPEGYILGRLTGCGKSTLGKRWYTNGIKNGNFFEGCLPDGWWLGTSAKSTKHYRTYNNGIENKVFKPGEEIPDGWILGRLSNSNKAYKKAASYRKVEIWNNGFDIVKIHIGEKPPEGYIYKGKIKNIRKKLRDKLLKDLGYIPLKDLALIYGRNWYAYLKDIDKVVFKDPFIYINLKEIPRIEEYISKNHGKGSSLFEKEIYEFIKSIYNGIIITNNRQILKTDNKLLEIDIFMPEVNVGIEANGIYWHSTNFIDKNYHLNKTKVAEKCGIRLLHIFEDLWQNKLDICKSIIKIALGLYDDKIFARNCSFQAVSRQEEKEFLNKNHLQGFVASSKCYGLYYKNELVLLVSFRKSRYKKGEYELLRHCTKLNYVIVGGFSKLVRNSMVKLCVSYIDKSLFTGKSYYLIGFTKISETLPSYYYFKSGSYLRLNRLQFLKHMLCDKLNNFDPDKTEQENMRENGYLIVYDCGTIKVSYNIEKC